MKKLISGLIVSLSLLCSPLSCLAFDNDDLLGYNDKGEILGIAQEFAVFVEEDFGADDADCEGRLFAGGNANLGNMQWYSTKRVGDAASAIVQGDVLKNFDGGDRIFVVGENTKVEIQGGQIVRKTLIDTEKEFSKLRQVSKEWASKESLVPRQDNDQIELIGESQVNYFYLENINSCNYVFNYIVPYGSYCIVNVPGKHPTIYTQLYGCVYGGKRISNNADSNTRHIIFNLYEAETFELKGSGTFYGSILAPNAKGYDKEKGTHETGTIIAKSYFGGVEFGGIGFDMTEDEDEEETTTTSQTTIETTSSSKETTTTSAATTTFSTIATSRGTSEQTTTTSNTETTTQKTTTTKKTTTTTGEVTTTTTPKETTTTTTTKRDGNPQTGKDIDWRTVGFIAFVVIAVSYIILKKRE